MKKALSLALALVLAFALAIPAFAVEVGDTEDVDQANSDLALGNKSSNAEVKYNVDGVYVVSVPDALDANTEEAQNVTASEIMLFYGETLKVTVTYDKLSVTDAITEDDIDYTIQMKEPEGDFEAVTSNETALLSIAAGTQDSAVCSVAIKAVLNEENPELYAGRYTDEITFNIEIVKE